MTLEIRGGAILKRHHRLALVPLTLGVVIPLDDMMSASFVQQCSADEFSGRKPAIMSMNIGTCISTCIPFTVNFDQGKDIYC